MRRPQSANSFVSFFVLRYRIRKIEFRSDTFKYYNDLEGSLSAKSDPLQANFRHKTICRKRR